MNNLLSLVLSVGAAYGLAVALVEKGDRWPVEIAAKPLRRFLSWLHPEAEGLMECAVCISFWTAGLTDLLVSWGLGTRVLWPLSGFLALGVTWTIYEFLAAIDGKRLPKVDDDYEFEPNDDQNAEEEEEGI